MVKIRLNRQGVRRHPIYRIVAVDQKQKKGGKSLEILGFWQPSKDSKSLNRERIKWWISQGAQLSLAVSKLLTP